MCVLDLHLEELLAHCILDSWKKNIGVHTNILKEFTEVYWFLISDSTMQAVYKISKRF